MILDRKAKEEVSKIDKKVVNAKVKKKKKIEELIPTKSNNPYIGKFTIQLGSHNDLKEAEKFADGFRIRGYNPIINEVELRSRGTGYRVSLGVFDSVTEAKEYIFQEKSLFQSQDYVIAKFD